MQTTIFSPSVLPVPADPDRVAVQQLIDRRLAERLGLSRALAGAISQLAGLGPDRRGRR